MFVLENISGLFCLFYSHHFCKKTNAVSFEHVCPKRILDPFPDSNNMALFSSFSKKKCRKKKKKKTPQIFLFQKNIHKKKNKKTSLRQKTQSLLLSTSLLGPRWRPSRWCHPPPRPGQTRRRAQRPGVFNRKTGEKSWRFTWFFGLEK